MLKCWSLKLSLMTVVQVRVHELTAIFDGVKSSFKSLE